MSVRKSSRLWGKFGGIRADWIIAVAVAMATKVNWGNEHLIGVLGVGDFGGGSRWNGKA